MAAEEAVAEIEHEAHPPYGKVFLILVALTAIEVALPLTVERDIAWIPMVFIAIWKICLIGGYFMHLKFDQRLLMLISIVPVFFGSILAFGLLMEYVGR